MALAYDASASGNVNPGTSVTYALTITGTNTYLVTGVRIEDPVNDLITGVTRNAVAMTRDVRQPHVAATETVYIYSLVNPATGNVVVSSSGSIGISSVSASYTGAKQSAQPDSSAGVNAALATSITLTTTVVASDCWLVGFGGWAAGGSISGGSGTTIRAQEGTFGNALGDSNGTVSTGAQSLILNKDSGSGNVTGAIISIAPFVAAVIGTTPRRTLMGVGS